MATPQWWLSFCKTPSTSTANYWPPMSGVPTDVFTPSSVENDVSAVMPNTGGTLKSMKVRLNAAPGSGKSYQFRVVKNGTPSAVLDLTISDLATTGTITGDIALSAGDTVSIECTPSGTPASVNVAVSLVYEPSVDNYFVYLQSFLYSTTLGTGINHQRGAMLNVSGDTTTADRHLSTLPFAGNIREIYVAITVAPGSGNTQRFDFVKAGSTVIRTVDVVDTNTFTSDTGLSIAVAAGDRLEIDCTHLSTPAGGAHAKIAVVIEPSTAGLFALCWSSSINISLSAGGNYLPIVGSSVDSVAPYSATEGDVQFLAPGAAEFSALYFSLSSVSNTGSESITIRTRKNSGNGNLTATSNSSSPLGASDTSHTDSISIDDLINLEIVGANSGDLDNWPIAIAAKAIAPSATGTSLLSQLTSSGQAVMQPSATGTPSLSQLSALGNALHVISATGDDTLPQLSADGQAVHGDVFTATGTPSLSQLIAAANASHSIGATGQSTLSQLVALAAGSTLGGTEYDAEELIIEWVLPEAQGVFKQIFSDTPLIVEWVLPEAYWPKRINVGINSRVGYGIFIHSPWWPYQRIAIIHDAFDINYNFVRMDISHATLRLPNKDQYGHNLHQGNILVIIEPNQPIWAGPIYVLEDSMQAKTIDVNAVSMEALLDARVAPQSERYTRLIGSTYVFRSLIDKMNARGHTGVYRRAVASGIGPNVTDFTVGGQSVLQALQELHNRTNWEWTMHNEATPGYLRSTIDWVYKEGQDLRNTIHLWYGVNLKEASLRHDLSQGVQAQTTIGGFGQQMWSRNAITRNGVVGSQRIDIGGGVRLPLENIVRDINQLPATLRNERVNIEVMANNVNELDRRADRQQQRDLARQAIVSLTANNLNDRQKRGLVVGNIITVTAPIGHHADFSGPVRLVGVQPDRELGEIDIVAEVLRG